MDIQNLEKKLGYSFKNRNLAYQALTHPSHYHEQAGTLRGDYQRLEFLGDALLGMFLAEMLYIRFACWNEGDLSRCRSQLAAQGSLATVARSVDIGEFIKLGRGEKLTAGKEKDSILADVLEALIAAIYLDGGLEPARQLVTDLFAKLVESPDKFGVANDSKSELQELLSGLGTSPPQYQLVGEFGPPHERVFRFNVIVNGFVAGTGEGRSKKIAQQFAASESLKTFKKRSGEN